MKKQLLFLGMVLFLSAPLLKAQSLDAAKVLFYLPFEDNYVDASASGATFLASTNAAATGTITYTTGKYGKAALFNLSPIVSQNLTFNPVNDFSVVAWISMSELPSVLGAGQTWIHQKDVTGMNPGRIHLEVLLVDYFGSFTSGIRCDDLTPTGVISTNTWYHVAHVNDVTGGTRKFYVNGFLVATAAIGTESNNGQLVIGGPKQETGGALIKAGGAGNGGTIDDLMMTSQVLDEATITKIMNDGVASILNATKINVAEGKILNTSYFNNGNLYFDINSDAKSAKLSVYNVSGQKVFEKNINTSEKSVNVNLNKGVYILKVTADNSNSSSKFSVL
jgi:hypothetical protein